MKVIITQILGWIATIIFLIMPIPQIIKTLKCKSINDVSVKMYFLYLIGNLIALIYAFLILQPALIFKYFLSGLIAIFYLTIYYKIKRLKNDTVK